MLDHETVAEIDRISRFPFLTRIGQPYEGAHVAVKNWATAEKKESSRRWEDYVQSCINHLSLLQERTESSDASERIRLEVRARTQPAREHIGRIIADNSKALYWPKTAGNFLQYAVMEFRLRHATPPLFFWPILLPILEAGRLPCGCNAGFLPLKTRQGEFQELPSCKLYIL